MTPLKNNIDKALWRKAEERWKSHYTEFTLREHYEDVKREYLANH